LFNAHDAGNGIMQDPVPAPLDASYIAPQSILKRAMPIAAQPWNLINALLDAYTRTLTQGIGQPWWNKDCKNALHNYRSGLCSKTDFRRITRWSQRQFWRDKLSTVTQMKDVFNMSTFRSPPLKDPLRPSSLPAVTIHEKRDVLVRNLLQNSAEAGDIPLDSPAVPITSLYFPDISMSQVEESILQAGNTAPGADEIPTCILKVAWPLIKDKQLSRNQKRLIGPRPDHTDRSLSYQFLAKDSSA
ncbi:hypothetical protein TSTA_039860, partial [Talaromyces stipitatus ATCC 10500]